MEALYTYAAAIGGVLLVGQFLLGLLGVGDHGGMDGVDVHAADFHGLDGAAGDGHGDLHAGLDDHGGEWFVGMLSFRAIVAAVTVFGLVGLGVGPQFEPSNPAGAFVIALAAGRRRGRPCPGGARWCPARTA